MKSMLTVHATMTTPDVLMTAAQINRRDREFDLSTIGYHFVIERDGKLVTGRKLNAPSVHDSFADAKHAISVCMVGGADADGVPQDNFTDRQWESLIEAAKVATANNILVIHSRTPALTTERVVAVIYPRNHVQP